MIEIIYIFKISLFENGKYKWFNQKIQLVTKRSFKRLFH